MGGSPAGRATSRVTLTDWDPEAEIKLAAAALYPVSELPDADLLAYVAGLGPDGGPASSGPWSEIAPTAGTSRAGPSSGRSIASTSSAISARSATSSATE